MGLKYFEVLGINNLDAQVEYNRVRPFTYSHWKELEGFEDLTVSNYSHFNQSLAHPLGANFTELILQVRYQPIQRLLTTARFLNATQGRTAANVNAGEDLLVNNNTRTSDFGQVQNQGLVTRINMLRLRLSYELTTKLYWDAELLLRNETTEVTERNSTYIGTGFRYNIGKNLVDY